MASMAATLAASAAAQAPSSAPPVQQAGSATRSGVQGGVPSQAKDQSSASVPARYEEALDVEGDLPIKEVELSGLALLKLLNHSTSPVSSSSQNASTDRYHSANNQNDAIGLLLGLDLASTVEIADSFPLPSLGQSSDVEKNGAQSFAQSVLDHLREVQTLDSPIGVYLSSHTLSSLNNASIGVDEKGMLGTGSGFLTKQVVELMQMVEKLGGDRHGKGGSRVVLLVHDAARSVGGDLSLTAYKFSEGFSQALSRQKFDTISLIEHRLTPSSLLTPLPMKTKSASSLNALLSSLAAPSASAASSSASVNSAFNGSALPSSFLPLQNNSASALPASLTNVLSSLSTLHQEQNNLAYQVRVVAREKARHEQAVARRQEENETRKRAGMAPLPDIPEPPAKKIQDPNRLDALLALGAVDQAAKGLAAEAGKGLVKVFAEN